MRELRLIAAVLLTAMLVVACAPSGPSGGAATTTVDRVESIGQVATGAHGAVATVDGLATQVGIEVLRDGGNAFDAAIAVGFALAVTHPTAGNIGGGGFMTIYVAGEDRYTTFDFRERAPLSAGPELYMDESGQVSRSAGHAGWTAVGVPGTVAGFAKVHAELGSLPWERLVAPAIHLARDGIVLGPALAGSLAGAAQRFEPYPASQKAFQRADGAPYGVGERLAQPDLAWSLEQIASGGADAFYKGEIARRLTEAMAANGGLITMEDLAAYEAKEREPIRGTYRGYDIISMGPPSSGGVAIVEMLNILENFELGDHEADSPQAVHLLTEAMRQAYLDRATFLGDVDFVDVPIERLTSKEYGREMAALIGLDRARSSSELGAAIITAPEPMDTTHYSVVDAAGNVVSTTYTLEQGYGSKAMAPGTGFLLNNEMGDFNTWPGRTDERGSIGTEPNLIGPGKRMLSSMSPTIIARDGKPVLVVGSPGGKTIINTVMRVVVNVLDFGMELDDAVAAPRLHHQWLPDTLSLEEGFPEATVAALRALGHDVRVGRGGQGDANSIFIFPGGARLAVADPRRAGAAAAY